MRSLSPVNREVLVAVIVLAVGGDVRCHAETYYLSPGGSDRQEGTSPQKAWQTISRANRAPLQPGNSVLLEGGETFPGNLLVRASGTAKAPITIASYGHGAATIRGGDSYGIRLLNCQYVEVRNLHLLGSGVTPRGVSTNKAIGLDIYSTATKGKPWRSVHVDRVTVKGFREGIVFHTPLGVQGDPPRSFDHFHANGIEFFKPVADQGVVGYDDVQITDCEVGECLFAGIYGWGSAKSSGKPWFLPVGNGTFTNCRIAGCLVHDIYCDPVGDPWLGTPIQLLNATGCTIERCTIRHCGQAANPKGSQGGIGGLVFLECHDCVAQFNECHHMVTTIGCDGCAFDIDGGCTRCALQYNYSHDNEGSGFQSGPFAGCSSLGDNTIRYNISQNDAKKNTGNTGGIMTWGSQPRGQIYNNSVFAGRGLKSNPAAFRGGDGFAVRNNIFVADHDGDIVVAGRGTFQNNCYWRTDGDLRLAGHADLAAWRKASGQERLDGADVGFQVDPRFRALGGGSIDDAARLGTLRAYDLLPSSPLAGKGLNLQGLFKIAPGPCDFHGTPLRQGMKFSLGASQCPAVHVNDLCVHDPFILADSRTKTYVIYRGYAPDRPWDRATGIAQHAGVVAYTSKDLVWWDGPKLVFEIPEGFWADRDSGPWAAEVHEFKGKYYLFTTFNAWRQVVEVREGRPPITRRGSQILVGDSPLGPFKPFANKPHTPTGELTLDGTFHVEDGQPWLVYCHEWVQLGDGLIKAIRLKSDLSETVGKPITLLSAAEIPWTAKTVTLGTHVWPGRITDGPELYTMKNGTLAMLWSSQSAHHSYAQAVAYSSSGKLAGPWTHPIEPLLQDDRGHGMIFRTFDGSLRLVVHRYFSLPKTRVQIWSVHDEGDRLLLGSQLLGSE